MDTPIADFVRACAASGTVRAHMPGHKGVPLLGPEPLDLTEIPGADSLYEADGIIAQSEKNASRLFGSRFTFFSTEGSSQCIRAMLRLALLHSPVRGSRTLLAGRNDHRALLSAACLLDLDLRFPPCAGGSLLSCQPTPEELDAALSGMRPAPFAVYLTSPDYLGGMADVAGAARVCAHRGVPLLVDNAHGAYLRFLPRSLHPLDLGAQLCCDSAHKTLPALTGAALLHVGAFPSVTEDDARDSLALFGSTSPSYLTLASLDLVNAYLADGYPEKLRAFCALLSDARERLAALGWPTVGTEPMKLTLAASRAGLPGTELAALLRQRGIECEFADPDFVTLMLTPGQEEVPGLLVRTLAAIPAGRPLPPPPPCPAPGERALSVREAMLAPAETIPAQAAQGRILAAPCVSCPPAVPVLMCGERVTPEALSVFRYYHIRTLRVVREE